jgi:hypothetical protein
MGLLLDAQHGAVPQRLQPDLKILGAAELEQGACGIELGLACPRQMHSKKVHLAPEKLSWLY